MNSSLKQPSPIGLLLIAILSVQFGSALAKSLFSELGPWGVVALRVSFSAVFLLIIGRPRLHQQFRQNIRLIITYGVVMALMNSAFYAAIDRIPLGIAISLEFTGPLGLAVLQSQQWKDGLWAGLATVGIFLLTPLSGSTLDPVGMGLALCAGLCWAFYIVLAARLGQALPGVEGLSWGLAVSSLLLLPVGIATTGSTLLNPRLMMIGFGVALLSTMLPYACEIMALRSLPIKVFGVMLSLEPMAGVVAGFLILGETLSVRSLIACVLVSIAAAGAAQAQEPPLPG
ncbi:MAG: EamA family transporter [Cyanobacteria bacterium J06631_12]